MIEKGDRYDVPWVTINGRPSTGVPSANYTFAEIIINNDQIQSNSSYYINTKNQEIIDHEFSHCWGLGHNPENQNSLMHNYSNYRKNTVQQVAKNVFNILYP